MNRYAGIWIVALVLSAPLLCYGQQNPPSTSTSPPSSVSSADDPVLKALNEMTARAIAAEAKNELYEGRVKDLYATIDAQKSHIALAEKQLEKQTANRADAGEIFTIERERISACQQQLAKADAEIFNLKNPGLLRELFAPKEVLKMTGAFLLGRATAPK